MLQRAAYLSTWLESKKPIVPCDLRVSIGAVVDEMQHSPDPHLHLVPKAECGELSPHLSLWLRSGSYRTPQRMELGTVYIAR
jgi:hypothetical protein